MKYGRPPLSRDEGMSISSWWRCSACRLSSSSRMPKSWTPRCLFTRDRRGEWSSTSSSRTPPSQHGRSPGPTRCRSGKLTQRHSQWDLDHVLDALIKFMWNWQHVQVVHVQLDVAATWSQRPGEASELELAAMGVRGNDTSCIIPETNDFNALIHQFKASSWPDGSEETSLSPPWHTPASRPCKYTNTSKNNGKCKTWSMDNNKTMAMHNNTTMTMQNNGSRNANQDQAQTGRGNMIIQFTTTAQHRQLTQN
jgi:hypothetical protein